MLDTVITPPGGVLFPIDPKQKKAPDTGGREAMMRRRSPPIVREPAVGIEPTTARLRIECSTTELRWLTAGMRDALCGMWNSLGVRASPAGAGRIPRPASRKCPGADSNRDALRHHPLKMACLPISPPGLSRRARRVIFTFSSFNALQSSGADGDRTRDLRCDRPAL